MMKFKKIMLITLVLLAVLTMGAVSAIDDADFNETLTVDTAEEVSADASLDENVVCESGDDDVVAAQQSDDVISDGNSNTTRMNPGMHVNVDDAEFGEPVEVKISFENAQSGTVNACLDNSFNYTLAFIDRLGTLNLANLNVGTHQIEVYYPGDLYYTDAQVTTYFNVYSGGNSTGGDDGEIMVGFWDENDERGTLYTDSEGWVVNVDVMDGSEGTIFVVVNGEEFSWDIQLDEWEDFPYHEWSLEDLNINQAGDYAVIVRLDDEIIASGTLHVSVFNNDEFRTYINYENENIRLFCPENSTGTVEMTIEIETDNGTYVTYMDTHEITYEDYVYGIIWYKEEMEIEDFELYRFTISVTNIIDEEIYRVSQWFSFGEDYEEGIIDYHGTNMVDDADGLSQGYSEIITYSDGMWQTENFFSFRDYDGDKTINIYINDNQEWYFPDENLCYSCNLYDLSKDGDFYILPVGDLNLTLGEHYVHADYGGDWREVIITLYWPQITQDASNTIEINPIKTIIKEDDCFITIANNLSGQIRVLIDNETIVRIPIDNLRRNSEGFIIGSKDLGINREGSHIINVNYGGLEAKGEINPISNVEIMIQTSMFEDSVVIGYGHDMNMIAIFLREGNVRDLDGAVAVYLNDDETPALIIPDISGLEFDSDGNCYWIYHSQFGATTETKKISVVYCNGSEADVSNDREVNFTMLTPEYVSQFTEIEIRENVYSSSLAPVTIRFNGNPQSHAGVFDSKYVLYVNGEKIDREYIIFYPKGEGAWDENRIILDPNDPEVAELMNDDSLEFDVFNWLSVKYLHWACEEGLEIAVDELNMTSEGTYNITIKFTGAADGADELELVSQNVIYEINPDYASVEIGDEVKYRNDVPFLFEFEFAEGIFSESNRILIYINDVLAFNGAILYYEENETGEMERCELWHVTVSMLDESVHNEYGFLDVGEYEAAVYLVKGDNATPVEIGRNTFTVFKQKGNFTFELITEEDRHTYLYADVPEGNWEDYSLTINIGDSEEIYPEPTEDGWINAPEGWVERYFPDYEGGWSGWIAWFNEYCIFENDQIVSKEPLENIIGKGRVAIDLGILANNTHVFVAFNYGREPYYGLEYDCFNDEFTVTQQGPNVFVPSDNTLEAVQEAIDLAVNPGDIVDLSKFGEYDFGASGVTISNSNVILKANGSTVIKGYGSGNGLVYVTGSNVTVEGIQFIDTNPANNFTYGGSVNGFGVTVQGVTGGLVKDCSFIDFERAIDVRISSGLVIENNNFTGGYTTMIMNDPTVNKEYGSKFINIYRQSSQITVINNYFNGPVLDSIVFAQGSGSNIVENNTFMGNTYSIYFGGAASTNSTIRNNVFRDCGEFKRDGQFIEGLPLIDLRKSSNDISIENNIFITGENSILIATEQGNTAHGMASQIGNINVTANAVTKSSQDIEGSTITLFRIVCRDGSSLTPFAPIYVTDNTVESDIKILNVVYLDFDGNVTAENVMRDEWIVENGYIIRANSSLIDCNLTIDVEDAVSGEDVIVTVTVPADATGYINIDLNGSLYSSAIVNGQATFDLGTFNAGTYTVIATYYGDERYCEAQANKTFTVSGPDKVDPEINVSINDAVYPEDVVITIFAPADATGMVDVYVNRNTYTRVFVNGTASVSISGLEAGNYTAIINYYGDEKYNSKDIYKVFTVAESTKVDPSMDITVDNVLYGEDVVITTVTPADATGWIGVTVNNRTYTTEIINGTATVTISGLEAGYYTAFINYYGDEKYNSKLVYQAFTVSESGKVEPIIDVMINNAVYPEAVVINITAPADATGTVDVAVDGDLYTVALVNGKATASIPGLEIGYYTAFITYSGDENYNSKDIYKAFTVSESGKVDPVIGVTIYDATYGEDVNIAIFAPGDATGTVNITVSDSTYSAEIENGTAYVSIPGLKAGNYIAFITYSGDENYNSKAIYETFTVSESAKIDPKITVEINDANYGDDLVVTIVTPADAKGTVSVTVNNNTYTDTLNRTATIIVPDLNAGSYVVLVYYSGDGKYNSYSTMVDATVAKAASSITVNDATFEYGQIAVVPVSVDGATGVNASVIDYPDAEISYSNDEIIISGLAAGNYTLRVATTPDNNHIAAVADAKIIVNRISSTVSLSDIEFDYGESGTSTVNLTGASSFSAAIIEHVEGNVVIVGNAITVSGLDAGTYTLKVTTIPDANHTAAEANAKITVNKVNSAISVGNMTIDYGDDAVIPVRADGISSLNASVAGYPDAAISYSDDNTIIISGLNAGTYVLNVVAIPDKNHYASQDSATITVNKISSTVSLSDIVFDYGKSGTSTATLIGVSDIAAEVVGHDEANVSINGNIITVSGLDADTYTLKVTATPDANHIASEATAEITVNKVDSVIAVDDAVFRYGESAVVPVSVQGADSINASLVGYPDAEIDYLNDEIIISGLEVGNYTLKVAAIPDRNHNAAEASAKITVNRVIVTSANFNEYFNENGEPIGDFPELIFAGEFAGKQFNINRAVALIGENAKFTNTRFNIRSDNVSIRNMELKYQGANPIIDVSGVSGFTLENNNIEYDTAAIKASAVSVSDSDDVNIKDNYIKASGTLFVDGILVSNSNFTIDSNTISVSSGVDAEGINIVGSGNGNVRSNNVNVIANKTVYGINTTVIYQLNIIFVFNVIYGEGVFAVGINDDSELIGNNKVTLKAVQATGVIVNSENAEVTNNDIKLISAEPSPEDPTLESTATGVQVNTKSTVSYNTIDSFDKSVSVDGGCASEISYNTVNAPVTVSAVGTSLVGNDIETDKDKAVIISEKAVDTVVDNNVLTANGANGDAAISNEGTGTTISNNKAKPQLAIDPIADIFEGQGVVIVITADKNFTGNVNVQVGNSNMTASLINGAGKVNVAAGQLSVGKVPVMVIFDGNDKFTNDTVNTTFTVKAKTATAIKASAVTTTYGTSKNIVITLTDANGNALAGKQVTVVLNGVSKTITTDSKGQASYAIGTALAVKKYDVTFTFNGDVSLAKSTVTVKVTVNKANAKLTAKKKTFKAKKKTKKYTVTLKTDKNKVMKKIKLYLKVNGKTYTAKTNSKGKATFKITKLAKKGSFKATVTFKGNSNYKKISKNVKITVK